MKRVVFLVLIIQIFVAGKGLFAQGEPQTIPQFDKRAAKIPQTEADTGLEFNEGRMEIERQKWHDEIRMSGDVKDMSEIRRITFEEIRKLSRKIGQNPQGENFGSWAAIGGDQDGHNSGRSRDIAFSSADIAYLATCNGGLWKTTNLTASSPTWVPLSDRFETLSSGSVAVTPGATTDQDVVYYGSGEVNNNGGYELHVANGFGTGVFKSIDGGMNWVKKVGIDTAGTRIAKILIHSQNPNIVYVASNESRTSATSVRGGVLKSTDAGETWKNCGLTGFAVYYMVMNQLNPDTLFVSGMGKIFRSYDGGTTWTQIKTGLPTGSVGSIAIGISKTVPNVLYAGIGNSSTQGTLGVYYSSDNGDTWAALASSVTNYLGQQAWFANAVAVNPGSSLSRQVWVGGLDIYKSNDNGKTFTQATKWNDNVTASDYSHADVHNLTFNGGTLFSNNDGGISMSKNLSSWVTTINQGISSLQFVGADADPDFTFVIGGCQDNSTNRITPGSTSWHDTRGGDGGFCFVTPENPTVCYSEYIQGDLWKSFNSGNQWQQINPIFKGSASFYSLFDFDNTGTVGLAEGGSRLFVTYNGGDDKFNNPSSPNIGATAVFVFKNDPTYMWAGSSTNLWRSIDQGATFVKTTLPTGSGTVRGITSDPDDHNILYICTQGIGTGNKHVFKSIDGGMTVTALPNFPNLGCNAVAYQKQAGRVFVGTDRGVVYTDDEGANWYQLNDALPNAEVSQLHIRGSKNDILLASTYGRGCFQLSIPVSGVTGTDVKQSGLLTLDPIVPNPTHNGANISFTLGKPGVVTVTLLDGAGREIRILTKRTFDEGKNNIEFNTAGLARGAYFISVSVDGVLQYQRVAVE